MSLVTIRNGWRRRWPVHLAIGRPRKVLAWRAARPSTCAPTRSKAGRAQVLKALAKTGAVAGGYAPHAIRIAPPVGPGRTANVEAEAAHGRGWFEVQDEGSQIAAALAGAAAKSQVLDLCAVGRWQDIGAGRRHGEHWPDLCL